jgi:tRNA 2-thiouridine synthesizing protein B
MILHKISASPFSSFSLAQCIARLHGTDGVLLMQDGVYALLHPALCQVLAQHRQVYILQEDLQARGITQHHENFELISYPELVELSLEFKQVMSW